MTAFGQMDRNVTTHNISMMTKQDLSVYLGMHNS